MKRRPADRKGKYAAIVRINMPTAAVDETPQGTSEWDKWVIRTQPWRTRVLDNAPRLRIIIFTVAAASIRVADARKRSQTRSQYAVDRGSSAAWRFVGRERGGDNFRVARFPD